MISREEFKAHCLKFLSDNEVTISEGARKIGIPRSTLKGWLRSGIMKDDLRQKIAAGYPQVFGGTEVSEESTTENNPVLLWVPRKVTLSTKIEMLRLTVGNMSQLLRWFLLEATPEERNRLRDELGEDWKQMLNYTRAMTNETAFGIVREEGLINERN